MVYYLAMHVVKVYFQKQKNKNILYNYMYNMYISINYINMLL